MSLSTAEPPSPPSNSPPTLALDNKGELKTEKKSKTKVIANLKQQLHDCQSALVEIKKNASLKYLQLKMEYDDLNESYSKLEALKAQTQGENEALKRKLSSALGVTRVERLTELESTQKKLERELVQLKLERDEASKETVELRALCCDACQSKMKAPVEVPAPLRVRSLWSLFQLDEEAKAAEVTTSTAATISGSSVGHQQPPKKTFVKQTEVPQRIHIDLEPPQCINEDDMATDVIEEPERTASGDDDLEAMKKKMKDEIESMRSEWRRPGKKRVDSHIVRRDMRNKRVERTKSARNPLDSFFSLATAGLEDEEMNEEKSFYSLQRSFLSLPTQKAEDLETMTKRRSSRSTTNDFPKDDSEKCATTEQDMNSSNDTSKKEEASTSADEPDRRQSFLTMAADSFRGSIANLLEEVEEEDAPRKSFEQRLDNLRAKSLRAEKKVSKTSPPALRRSRTAEEREKSRSISWDDPSIEQDEVQQKILKEVEAWASVDLAPIMALGLGKGGSIHG